MTVDDRWVTGEAYEAYMGRWSRPLAGRFLDWLGWDPAAHWLDVGCGTGALTSVISERCAPASVVACDPSEAFIAHARQHLSDERVSFVAAPAGTLPERDGGFGAIVSGLVLNFLADPGGAVSAFRARLRPGGRTGAYVWDYAEGMEFLRVFWDEAVRLDAGAEALDEGRRFPVCRPEALVSVFRSAGLQQVDTGSLEIPTVFASLDDYWRPFLRGTGPAPGYVASLDDDRRAELKARVARRLPTGPDGTIPLRARAWAVRGRRGE
jgi:SAM-dependent methyltransferase